VLYGRLVQLFIAFSEKIGKEHLNPVESVFKEKNGSQRSCDQELDEKAAASRVDIKQLHNG
jgi:hypothetical protein